MEWNDNEKKIIGQLQRHTEEVDTESLWHDIRPHLPKRRKRNWVPFFLFFLFGMGTGIGGYYLTDSERDHSSKTFTNDWTQEKAELLQQLKACEEAAMKAIGAPTVDSQTSQVPADPNTFVPNTIVPNTIGAKSKHILKEQNFSDFTPDTETATTLQKPDLSSKMESPQVLPDVKIHIINPEKVILVNKNTVVPIEPVSSQIEETNRIQGLHYLTAAAGPTFITDILKDENTRQKTVHRPMYHIAFEYGQQKRLLKNMMWNLGVNYTGMVSNIRYQTTQTEELTFTDTLGYYIGADGVTSTQTGEVLATRITQKSGTTYSYSHRLFLHPSLEYDIRLRKSSSLSVRAGMMWPLISWQKNSLLTPEGDVTKLAPSFRSFERPMLRGGLSYQTIIYHKNIGVYLDFLMGSQKIHTGSYTSVRTFLLPQTGMRIFF